METKPPLARRSHTLLSTRDRDRERERDVITLSRYRLCERNESSLSLSFHLLHVENNDPRCFNCSQPGVLFDSMRWTNTWIDRGSIWPQRSIRESARFVEKSDGTTRHYRPTTIICDGLKPRITAKRSQSGPDNPANSSGPNQRVPINFRSHNDRLPPSSPDLIGPSPRIYVGQIRISPRVSPRILSRFVIRPRHHRRYLSKIPSPTRQFFFIYLFLFRDTVTYIFLLFLFFLS